MDPFSPVVRADCFRGRRERTRTALGGAVRHASDLQVLVAAAAVARLPRLPDALLGGPFTSVSISFDLDEEGNIPTWFSSIQLFLIGSLL